MKEEEGHGDCCFSGAPLPRLCPSQPPERSSNSRLHKDRGAAVTPKSGTPRPPSHPCRDIERIQFSAGLRALVSLLGSQGTRFSTLCTVRASNKRLSRSPTQRTRLGETRWEEAPGPCAQLCIDRVRPRSPPPSVHPNSADPLRQSGTQRAGTLPGPSRTSDGCPQPAEPPVLLASLQPHPCSGVLAPRSGSAGPRSQRAGSGSAPRRVRNP